MDALNPTRDADASLFQSALAAAEQRARAAADPAAPPGRLAPVDHHAPLLQALARAVAHTADMGRGGGAPQERIDDCARRYLALARAEASRDAVAIAAAREAMPAFGACDLRWSEALADFLLHAALRRHSDVPYRVWASENDFVLDGVLGDKARIAIVGDWGTGEPRAQALLAAVAQLRPDVLIHLGDIYYSGSLAECDAFYRNVREALPTQPVFSLCGNHDMYSGGAPYYALIDRLGQPSSYFCLRNARWQILAMDTGYNDYDPIGEKHAVTWVRDGTGADGADVDDVSEIDWHADKFARAGSRRTVLLSHHPPFTRHAPIGDGRVRNARLLGQVEPFLGDVALWLWGHEHAQLLYQPFAGVLRGRCLGASAIPTLPVERPDAASADFAAGEIPPRLVEDPSARLGIDPGTGWLDLGFGLLDLDGAAATMTYYGFNTTQGAWALYCEPL